MCVFFATEPPVRQPFAPLLLNENPPNQKRRLFRKVIRPCLKSKRNEPCIPPFAMNTTGFGDSYCHRCLLREFNRAGFGFFLGKKSPRLRSGAAASPAFAGGGFVRPFRWKTKMLPAPLEPEAL
ncbi:MAG: hypothetical protein D6714_14640 [Bacteroidetes bacterium]|nr:MAG: hypothetical protein D6714_14640 [Bacteroidota bacterium]